MGSREDAGVELMEAGPKRVSFQSAAPLVSSGSAASLSKDGPPSSRDGPRGSDAASSSEGQHSFTSSHGPKRRSFIQTIAAVDETSSYCPHMDELDFDRLESKRHDLYRGNTGQMTIFDESTERRISVEHSDVHEQMTSSSWGLAHIIQGIALLGTIAAYVAPPVVINWSKTVGYNETTAHPIKVETFLGVSVIIFSKGFIVLVALSVALYWDRTEPGNGYVRKLLGPANIVPWIPIGGGYAVADIAEVMANGKIDAATYTILSQSRLVGTAVAMRMMIGVKRSYFQWSVLTNLSLVLIGWKLTPNNFGAGGDRKAGEQELLGYGLTVLKMVLSIICGVLSQKTLHGNKDPMIIQQGNSCIAGVLCSIILAPILIHGIYPAVGTPWTDNNNTTLGFFEGKPIPEDVPTTWPITINSDNTTQYRPAGEVTGWDWKTCLVLGIYIFREVFCTYCIKRFNALVKNICNAAAMVVTYIVAVYVLNEMDLNVVKAIFALVICLEIVHYGLAES